MKCLQKLPAERYQKAWQISEALATPPVPGIWSRSLAQMIDLCVMLMSSAVVVIGSSGSLWPWKDPYLLFPLQVCLFFAASILYYAIFESSKLQATPGKLLFGLKVYDKSGARIPFLRAFYSRSVCIFTVLLLESLAGWGLVLAFCVPNHFYYTITVMMMLPFWLCVVNLIPSAFNHGLQYSHDKIFGRFVAQVYVNPNQPKTERVGFSKGLKYIGLSMLPAACILLTFFGGFYSVLVGEDTVVIAIKEIDEGAVITDKMVTTAHTLKILNAKQAVHNPKLLVGRIADHRIPLLDAVTERDLEPANYQDVMNRTFKNQKHWRVIEIIDPYTGRPITVW